METTPGHSQSIIKPLENFLAEYLIKKAPFQLPVATKEFIVKVGPWVALILIIMALPMLMSLFGLSYSFMSLTSMYGVMPRGFGIYLILALVPLVLEIIALPGLFKKSRTGWNFLFYAELVMIVQGIVGGTLGPIIGSIIGLYFLFQVREYYK